MLDVLYRSALWLLGSFALFSVLARFWALHPGQPLWRKEAWVDVIYWFLPSLLYRFLYAGFIALGLTLVLRMDAAAIEQFMQHGRPEIARLPLWTQCLTALLVTDVIQYWVHRLFHGIELWRFHAVHHAPKEIDWLTSARFHPINMIFYSTLVAAMVFLIGFSPEIAVFLVPFNALYSGLVHANLNWTFGPLRYALASPVFHRWHHTFSLEGGNKNFAPTFPFLDVLFGTFYMPMDRRPERYGIDSDDMPSGFLGQLKYPFTKA